MTASFRHLSLPNAVTEAASRMMRHAAAQDSASQGRSVAVAVDQLSPADQEGGPAKNAGRQSATGTFRKLPALLAATVALALSGCGSLAAIDPATDGQLKVVTTTGILADLVRNVAGDQAQVTQLVPDGADPHSYEPSLRALRDVAYADVAFTNYLLLEEHSIIKALDAALPKSALSVSIAEEAAKQGATILPLVEDRSLDTPWLGMRVAGSGSQYGATRASEIDLIATAVDGPGQAASYLTTSFGSPEIGFASSDGFNPGDGFADDTTTLPADAHQHMSWAFSAPGIYRIQLQAALRIDDSARPIPISGGQLVFAVGVEAGQIAAAEGREVIEGGHGDVTVDLDGGRITVMLDAEGAAHHEPSESGEQDRGDAESTDSESGAGHIGSPESRGADDPQTIEAATAQVPGLVTKELDRVVISVPPRTLQDIPGESAFRFLGEPGSQIYLLPQAVLGKHVHGEIDPHLWHDAHNAAAYVRVIRDRLVEADPDSESTYRANAADYLAQLEEVDAQVAATISTIPAANRQLVTTNDAYGYLASAYGLSVAGFVAPNPATEPSLTDRRRLAATIADLNIPAVFLEPNLARTRSTLKTVAAEAGVAVCPLYGDTLDQQAATYLELMRFNANSLANCLGGVPND